MRVHIVQKGDTLWKIAKQHQIGFEELKRLNGHLLNPDCIVPGMEVVIPDGELESEESPEVIQEPVAPPYEWQGNVPQQSMPIPYDEWQVAPQQYYYAPQQMMPQWQFVPPCMYMQPPYMSQPYMQQPYEQQIYPQQLSPQPYMQPQYCPHQMMPMQPMQHMCPMHSMPMPQEVPNAWSEEQMPRYEEDRVKQYYDEIKEIERATKRCAPYSMPCQVPPWHS